MASSTPSVTRAAGLPNNPRSQLIKPSNATPKVSSQTSAPQSSRSSNMNHTRLKKSEEYYKGESVRVDQKLSNGSRDSPLNASEPIISSFWTKANLPSAQQNISGQNENIHNARVMKKDSGDNNLIPSRVAEVASALTQEVSKMWSFKIPPLGISSNDEESESDLTKAMRAYHLSKAREPSDLPAWLFTDAERGGGSFFRSEPLPTGGVYAKKTAQPELEHNQRRNLNLTRRDIHQARVDHPKDLKSITGQRRLRMDLRR